MNESAESGGGLLGLPQFMRFMATRPDAQSAVEALLHGPFSHLRANACHIYQYENPNRLVLYGGQGLEEGVMARCQSQALEMRTPLSEAFLEGAINVTSLVGMLEKYPSVRLADDALWQEYILESGDQTLVCVPIVMNGVAVGGYSVFLPPEYRLTGGDCAVFEGIGALLGLWMTHNAQIRALQPMDFRFSEENSVCLTERQLAILAMVDDGRSISAITRTLGYSQSTIRQELQRSMKLLRVGDRKSAAMKAKELGLQLRVQPVRV